MTKVNLRCVWTHDRCIHTCHWKATSKALFAGQFPKTCEPICLHHCLLITVTICCLKRSSLLSIPLMVVKAKLFGDIAGDSRPLSHSECDAGPHRWLRGRTGCKPLQALQTKRIFQTVYSHLDNLFVDILVAGWYRGEWGGVEVTDQYNTA